VGNLARSLGLSWAVGSREPAPGNGCSRLAVQAADLDAKPPSPAARMLRPARVVAAEPADEPRGDSRIGEQDASW
jgi:hypothetical protein